MMSTTNYHRMLERDGGRCVHCGTTETLVPQHRMNRGMGGSKERDRPSNVVTLCSWINGQIESDENYARLARVYGWKLRPWEEPEDVAVYDRTARQWFVLDNTWTRREADDPRD